MTMKIAMIGHKRIPSREGGVEIVVEQLSTALVEKGHTVVAYNRKGHHISGKKFDTNKAQKEHNGVKLKTVFTFQSSKLNAIVYSILASIRATLGGYDVVHFHAEGPASMCFLPKLTGKRVIVTIHGLDWQRSKWGGFATKFLKFGEKMAAKHADEVIVLSQNVKQYFLDTYGRETVYIPNGITRPELKPDNEIKEKFALTKDSYILFLGRIVPEKCVHLLIDAYKDIETDKKLVIAGGSSHTDEYMNEVKALANGNDKIIFTDFVQGELLEELYSNAYIYCLPSSIEGMPISLLEAMSYGNCCLTSDIPECTEVCGDKAASFEKNSKASLKAVLQDLLNNEELVNSYKQASRDYICEHYGWDKVVEQTIKLYGDNDR